MRLRAPFGWLGGKYYMVNKFLKYVPSHKYYLEVFGGACNLLLAKEPSAFEVYNDIDSGLFNFWKVLKDKEKFERFRTYASLTYFSREIYNYCREHWKEQEDDVEKAYMWWIVARFSFSGIFGSSFGVVKTQTNNGMVAKASSLLSSIELLPEVHARFQRVSIENKDWEDCLNGYATLWNYENSFIYLDPPYVPEVRRSGEYKHELTREDHKRIINYLITNQNQNKFMISGYANDIYSELEKHNWKKMSWEIGCSACGRIHKLGLVGEGATQKNQRREECIWMNYEVV